MSASRLHPRRSGPCAATHPGPRRPAAGAGYGTSPYARCGGYARSAMSARFRLA